MKKRYFVFLLICLFLFPFGIQAEEGIEKYYIDATLKSNGDLEVKEVFLLNGDYNGFERIIHSKNYNLPAFTGDKSSFEKSDIYNPEKIVIEEVGGISIPSKVDFSILNQSPILFENDDYSTQGSYGTYSLKDSFYSYVVRIYNPSSYHNAFYIKYTVKNLAVLHEDYGEVYWNIFSNELNESIHHLEMYFHLEGNQKDTKVWAHGPLHGESKIVDKETLYFTIDNLGANTAFDIRTIFDKEVISESSKQSGVVALDKILSVEQERADDANRKRTQMKLIYYGFLILDGAWILGFLFLTYKMYQKYDKEYEPQFKGQYFRDFPKEYGPEIVGYLFHHKIDTNELSAAILNLISDKVISVEEIGKKDYRLTYLPKERELKKSDQILIAWLFGKIGDDNQVTLKEIQDFAKKKYDPFIDNYEKWKSAALEEAEDQNFFEHFSSKQALAVLYSISGVALAVITMMFTEQIILPLIIIVLSIIGILYFSLMKKRTKSGNEDYAKWKGLRNFLNDFGNFEAKELPEIQLWEKYLVYATVFGIAKKLSQQMEIKFKEMPSSTYTASDFYFDTHYMYMMTNFSRTMNHSMTSSMQNARASYAAAHSSSSSGSGMGGGFSSGGGFGGGGGGGGRF